VQPVRDLERLRVLRLGSKAELNHALRHGLVRLPQCMHKPRQGFNTWRTASIVQPCHCSRTAPGKL
jgi:hypothetical protein